MCSGPELLGRSRLVTIDGHAGSGKTTLAGQLASELPQSAVIHMDDLYDGWTGLNTELFERLNRQILDPLRQKSPANYRRYDWDQECFAGWQEIPPLPHIIIEGVGAGDLVTRPWATVKVWLDVSATTSMARGLRRDTALAQAARLPESHSQKLPANWAAWEKLQSDYFAASGNMAAADLQVSTD